VDLGEWVCGCCWVGFVFFLRSCVCGYAELINADNGSDAPSFEMAPLVGDHNKPGGLWKGEEWEGEMQGGGLLHQWLLGGWGVMIGEMWDLERLCEKAEELGRYTCFVSSVPLKVSQILEID